MRKFTKAPLAGVLALAFFAGLIYLFAWSSIFSVSVIRVSGAPTPESQSAIVKIVDVASGSKLARVEPRAIAHRIEQLPWIKNVEISRNWYNGKVGIAITPRTPTAYFNGATIDASGAIFSLPGFSGGNLPRVTAPTPQLGLSAIALFQGLPQNFSKEIISLSAHNDSNFAMQISLNGRELRILWGKNEKSDLKIEVIKALAALKENKNIRRIDVSAPHAPIVK